MLAAGHRLGPYEIISVIGTGGMGEVYRAKDTRLDRTVAIKVLSTQLSDNPIIVRVLKEKHARSPIFQIRTSVHSMILESTTESIFW